MTIEPRRIATQAILATLIIHSEPANAAVRSTPAHEARLGACIRDASRGRVWLEKTLWGLRDQEGGWIGAEVPNDNGSHDLGPLQVNSSWVPKLATLVAKRPNEVRAWLIGDPCFNVQAARWIFLSGLHATGDYWKAIGVYHSPTASRQRRYAESFIGHLRRRYGPSWTSRRVSEPYIDGRR